MTDPAPTPHPPGRGLPTPPHPTHPTHPGVAVGQQGWHRDGKTKVQEDLHRIFFHPIFRQSGPGPERN